MVSYESFAADFVWRRRSSCHFCLMTSLLWSWMQELRFFCGSCCFRQIAESDWPIASWSNDCSFTKSLAPTTPKTTITRTQLSRAASRRLVCVKSSFVKIVAGLDSKYFTCFESWQWPPDVLKHSEVAGCWSNEYLY